MKILLIGLLMVGCSKAKSSQGSVPVTLPVPAIEKELTCEKLEVVLDETLIGYIKKVKVNKHTICYVFFDEDGQSTMDCVRHNK